MSALPPGTAVFETDYLGEAKFYADQLGEKYTVTAGVDTLYAVRVKQQPDAFRCITKYAPPPIPDRRFDWSASLPNAGEDDPVGYGATQADAIAELMIELESA